MFYCIVDLDLETTELGFVEFNELNLTCEHAFNLIQLDISYSRLKLFTFIRLSSEYTVVRIIQ